MARTTGNTAPSGFAAGQLRDGQSIGVFDWYNSSKFEIRVRHFQGKLIAEIRWQNGGNWGNWAVQARSYFDVLIPGHTAGAYTELNDSVPLFATLAEVQALGIPMPGGLVPTAPSNALIPFQADADGRVTAYTSTVTTNEVIKTLADTQQQITNSLTGNTSSNTTGTTGTNNTLRNVLIITGVISVVVIIGIVIWKAVKK